MRKAKQLEQEMHSIKQAKVDVVVKQFEAQIMKDAKMEERRVQEQLNSELESQLQKLSSEKHASLGDIANLQKQLQDQINFLKVVQKELGSKS